MPNIERIRRLQTATSVLLFALVFIVCWLSTDFKITEIQLSYWGKTRVWWLWSFGISAISILTFFNVYLYVILNSRIKNRKIPIFSFAFSCLCLLLVGAFNIDHKIHDPAAYLYFFSYPLSIFLLSYLNRKTLPYKSWQTHVFFVMAMTLLPFSLIGAFKGMAIAEITHTTIVILWNIWLLKDQK